MIGELPHFMDFETVNRVVTDLQALDAQGKYIFACFAGGNYAGKTLYTIQVVLKKEG
jgi:hypothetical protein